MEAVPPPFVATYRLEVDKTHHAPSRHAILCTFVHVAGLQRGRRLSIGGADGVLHHTGARSIMGDALHSAHLGASAAAHRAGVPLTGSPAEGARRGQTRS